MTREDAFVSGWDVVVERFVEFDRAFDGAVRPAHWRIEAASAFEHASSLVQYAAGLQAPTRVVALGRATIVQNIGPCDDRRVVYAAHHDRPLAAFGAPAAVTAAGWFRRERAPVVQASS